MAAEVEGNDGEGRERLGDGHGEPDAGSAEEPRDKEERGNEEDDAAEKGKSGGRTNTLDALEIAHSRDIENEGDEAAGKKGEALDGKAGGSLAGIEEETDKPAGE